MHAFDKQQGKPLSALATHAPYGPIGQSDEAGTTSPLAFSTRACYSSGFGVPTERYPEVPPSPNAQLCREKQQQKQ